MSDIEEEIPQGEPFDERTPVDPLLEFSDLLQRPPSSFAPFNDLMICARAMLWQDGLEASDPKWMAAKSSFDREVAEVTQFLLWSSRYQEQTPDFVEPITQVFSLLELLQFQSARLDEAVQGADAVNFVFSLEQLEFSLGELSTRLQSLRELEEKQPKFSQVPYVQDLFRLAGAVRRGALEVELLAERLVAFEEVQGFVREALREQGGLSSADLEPIEAAFDLQDDGLDMLFAYLESGNPSALDKGLDCVQQAWDRLLGLRQEVLLAQEQADLPTCLRCGMVNPAGVRRCSACHSRLPEQVGLHFSMEDCAVTLPTSPGANLERIQSAASRLVSGQLSLQQFADEIEREREACLQAAQLLDRLDLRGSALDFQELEDFKVARDLYAQGLEHLDEGIFELEQFIEHQRRSRLRLELPPLALEKIRLGQDYLLQMNEFINRL